MDFLVFEQVIDQRTVENLLTALGKANAPDGIYVNSPGGSFEFFSILGPALQRRGIVTLSGNVRSAAVILALLGRRRYALPDATFFFHEVRTLVRRSGAITVCDLEEVLEYQDRMSGEMREGFKEWLHQMHQAQNWFLHFLSQATGIPQSTFRNLMRSEATLTAQEARRYQIVHEILPKTHW